MSLIYESPKEFAMRRNTTLLFHRGIPYCLWVDKFGWNNRIFWSRSTQESHLCRNTKNSVAESAIAAIEQGLRSYLCPFCMTTMEGEEISGRKRCLTCLSTPSIYLWLWDEQEKEPDLDLVFNKRQWDKAELGL